MAYKELIGSFMLEIFNREFEPEILSTKVDKLEIEIEKLFVRLKHLEHQYMIKDNYVPFNNRCKL